MQSIARPRFLAAAAVALGLFGLASAAQARSDVHFSIGLGVPVYTQPAPYYVQPQPVYVQPRAYVAPATVYVQPGYRFEDDRDWRRDEWRRREWRRHHHEGRWHHDRRWD